MTLIPVLRRQGQADLCEFNDSLVYNMSSKRARATQRNSVSKIQKKKRRRRRKRKNKNEERGGRKERKKEKKEKREGEREGQREGGGRKEGGWRDGSRVKSTDCSSEVLSSSLLSLLAKIKCRGPDFNSQQTHGGSQPSDVSSGALFLYSGHSGVHARRMLCP